MLKPMPDYEQRGFTLIELLIVIVIIVALAVAVFVALNPVKRLQDARNARRISNVDFIRTAIQSYLVDNGSLPPGLSSGMPEMQIGKSNGTGVGANNPSCINTTGSCNATSQSCVDLSGPLATYLKTIPQDPKIGSPAATGYSVSVDANNIITVNACGIEGSSVASGTVTPVTICSNHTSFCIGASTFYPYGASFYGPTNTNQPSITGNVIGQAAAISLAQTQHLNSVRTANWLNHNDTIAQAENSSSSEWTGLDNFIADAQNASPNIRVFLDISDFKIILMKSCKNWVTDYSDWDTLINEVATRVNSVTGKTYGSDPEIMLVYFSGEPRETNKYYANDNNTHYIVSGTSPALSTITESNWGTAFQVSGSSAGCGDPTIATNDFYYTSKDLTNLYHHLETQWKTVAGTSILTMPGGLSKLDISTVRSDIITDTSSSSTITDASIVANDAGSNVTGNHIPAGAYVGTVTAGTSFVLVNSSATAITPTGSDTSINIRPNGGQDYKAIYSDNATDVCSLKTYGNMYTWLTSGYGGTSYNGYCATINKPLVNVEWGYDRGADVAASCTASNATYTDSEAATCFQNQFTNNNNAGVAGNFFWNTGTGSTPTFDVDGGTNAPLTEAKVVSNAP